MKSLDLVVAGSIAIDYIKIHGKNLKECFGGAAFNTAYIFGKLGGTVAILGGIGEDVPGRKILKRCAELGINTTGVREELKYTFLCDILVDSDRHFSDRTPFEMLTTIGKHDEEIIKSAKALYLDLRNPLFDEYASIAYVHDVALYLTAHMYKGPKILLQKYDPEAVMGNSKEHQMLKNSDTIPKIITHARYGARLVMNDKDTIIPSYDVAQIDFTGAGDAFAAGFIDASMSGYKILQAVRVGNACAATVISHVGAQPMKFSKQKVIQLLLSKNYRKTPSHTR